MATYALTGVPAIDSGVTASLGPLHGWGRWNTALIESIGASESQFPTVVPMCQAGGTVPGTDTVFAGGSIDAFCDQIVSGANEPGDVLAIFGGAHRLGGDRRVDAGSRSRQLSPHHPGPVPHRGPQQRRGPLRQLGPPPAPRRVRPGPDRERLDPRLGNPDRVPVWLPYIRGERTPLNDHTLRSNLYGLDIGSDAEALERARSKPVVS